MATITAETMASLALRATTTMATSVSNTASSTATSTAIASTSSRPPAYRVVGIILAISSGFFIGVSFVIKKVGLLKANKKYNEEAGEGYGYLKNAWWWLGMSLMIVGEICNFVAYAFVDAILVTPMGSLSVVISTILSSIFLKERLSFVGWVGCFQCIVGSVIIVANAPQNSAVATIQQMQHYVIAPGFLTYAGVILVGCVFIALWAGPRYGKKSMLIYISICSLIGGLSVVATQGLGAAIVAQIAGTPQFNQWFLYVLFVFVIGTLLTEIIYLNKALNIFNASIVTPTYYVYFTSSTIVTSAILFQGLDGTVMQLVTLVLGFLVICSGVVLLQLSKSSKDVPDTAVFQGDLDQIRTMAEVKEPESEPKADAIRGGAAILRTFSKSHLRREAEEVDRIQNERLESISEDEQVEWDGLRRRKTIVAPGQTPLRRRKTIHPPLGMSHFPEDDSDNESRRPEDDHGIFPSFRKRSTILHSKRQHRADTISQRDSNVSKSGSLTSTLPLSSLSTANYAKDGSHDHDDHGEGDLGSQHQRIYDVSDDLKRATSIGLSSLQAQETEYRSQTSPRDRSLSWAEPPVRGVSSHSHGRENMHGPPPPPHGRSAAQDNRDRRQFSFQNVFLRGTSPGHTSGGDEDGRPTTGTSYSSFGSRVFNSLRRTSGMGGGGRTEEERLGLVQGDPTGGRIPTDHSASIEAEYEDDVEGPTKGEENHSTVNTSGSRKPRRGRTSQTNEHVSDYDGTAYEESPERISSSDSGSYAKVRRKDVEDDYDDYGGAGQSAQGAAFV